MPVKLGEREFRTMPVLAPVGPEQPRLLESEYYVEGAFTTFNKPYILWEYEGRSYYEQVHPSALDEADMSDVILRYDHEGRVLARNRNKTLVISIGDEARIGADLSKGESARQLYEEIVNGLVDRMSWMFTVASDSVVHLENGDRLRTILKVKKVFDVAPVSIPGNDATDISARSWVDGVIEQESRSELARRKRVLELLTRL